ncbi:MAG: hypothetical protein N2738_05145, partial [Thermodesulfovibrionales bacterium]|nr:hypothetical protein [Thermodesulfovibrionales bacterium]
MSSKTPSLYQHINKIFIFYTLLAILFVSLIASFINYSIERKAIYNKMSHMTDMFISLSDNFFNKYND